MSDAQVKDAITKHTGVRKTLHNAYYATSFVKSFYDPTEILLYEQQMLRAYKSSEVFLDETQSKRTSRLVGSYGKNTAIAPPSDIDILFELPLDQYSRYENYAYNGQSQLLQDIKKVLEKTYPRTAIRADGQIVLVPFTTYSIEVLPAFKRASGGYYYPDTHNGGSWKITDPKAEIDLIRASNKRSNGNTIKLIKMLKAWKQYCNVPIKSLVLELRSINFLENWEYYDKPSVYHDWMIRDFFARLIEFQNGNCPMPGTGETIWYGDAWLSKAETALKRSQTACELESQESYALATIEWQKLFGNRYPY
ncbi:MAG: nucleotidyltransferase [Anaerolineaceae bacterium]|nr:nucleotidyltransferase [Anaerolineaceae bacterium]